MSLKGKTISGILWSLGQQFSLKIVGFIITIFLARLLSPAEFGLIAMLSVFISVGHVLSDSGLTSSLIRTSSADEKDYTTAFYFNITGSIAIYIILFFSAPVIASFYRQAMLTGVIRVYSLTILINAFFAIQSTILTKEMAFRKQANMQVPAAIGGGILGIILAKSGYGVWSLVWMNLCSSFLSTVMHWIYSSWRPSLLPDLQKFRYHFRFGYKIALSGILESIHQNMYTLVIGKFYSATQLGFYSRAEAISQLPVSNISYAINKVTYPLFSALSQDDVQLKKVYKRIMQQVIFWNAPILIFLCIIAEPLFRFLITDKWLPAVPYFQILCFTGILYPLHAYNLNILKVKGRSDLILKLEVIKKSISVIGIISVIPFGIYGLLYFQLVFTLLGYYINSVYSGQMISYPAKEQLTDLLPILVLAIITGGICYFTDQMLLILFQLKDLLRIAITGFSYTLIYLGTSNILKLNAIIDFKQLILKK